MCVTPIDVSRALTIAAIARRSAPSVTNTSVAQPKGPCRPTTRGRVRAVGGRARRRRRRRARGRPESTRSRSPPHGAAAVAVGRSDREAVHACSPVAAPCTCRGARDADGRAGRSRPARARSRPRPPRRDRGRARAGVNWDAKTTPISSSNLSSAQSVIWAEDTGSTLGGCFARLKIALAGQSSPVLRPASRRGRRLRRQGRGVAARGALDRQRRPR